MGQKNVARYRGEKKEAAPAPPFAPSVEETLHTQIRDLPKEKK